MKQTFTKQYMEDNRGCYSIEELNRCSFMKNEEVKLQAILESEIKLKHKFWFVCKKLATKKQNQEIAIGVTEIVLPIFEERYPDNKAPRECIEAAKQYIAGHISLEALTNKKRAAYCAADAAYAACAAYANDVAYAAAYAAYAACAAYANDVAYAAACANEEILLTFLISICNQPD